ncbi:FtsX-like permease family protein [Lachnospiraceae bacterium]|nr:FtsX-like permease family protein [Lachnospiraceae bacterium]
MLSKLIKSNFKNDFSHMITFFLIMVLSVFMLHTGIMILIGYNTVYKEKLEKYNLADLIVLSALKPEEKEKTEEIISTSDFIESYEKVVPISKQFKIEKNGAADGDSKNSYDTSTAGAYVLPYGSWGEIDAPHFCELSEEEYDNPIYISLYYNANFFKAKLGDSIDIQVDDKYYTFQVAGIYEGILANMTGMTYVSPSLYDEWKLDFEKRMVEVNKQIEEEQKAEEAKRTAADSGEAVNDEASSEEAEAKKTEPLYTFTLFNMKLAPGVDSVEASGKLTQALNDHDILAAGQGVDEIITIFSFMQNIIGAMLMAFSFIIAIISMIIIYFRITNSIEQNITNIGALKALGYTSQQIRQSMILEFLLTTGFAAALGIGSSYLVVPVFEKLMRSSSGVMWEHAFDPIALAVTLIFVLGTVLLVATVSTRNIIKLDPVIALRFGLNDSNFKKNHAPVEYTPGPLTWIMALKSLLGNTKQNIILLVVMTSIGLVTTFSAFLAYNCAYDPMHLYRMLQLTACDVNVYMADEDMSNYSDLKSLPEVENIWWIDNTNMYVEGYSAYTYIAEDWSAVPDINVYEGRAPIYDNEIAIGGVLARILKVGVGDEVAVSYGGTERRYIITGFEQDSSQMGKDISMTQEGAEHLNYDVNKSNYFVNVKDHSLINSQNLVKKSEDMFGDKMSSYMNIVEELSTGEDMVIQIAATMAIVMVLVCLAVIVLSMNLLVKTLIIKKQQEIGIKKALGFSSDQLRIELVLSMLPQIGIGAAIGALIGVATSNKALALMLTSVGIMRSNMDVYPWMGFAAIVFAIVVSFFIIWIISGRIKKISAYSLITE